MFGLDFVIYFVQGQTCFDVADPDVLWLLEECIQRQAIILRERPEISGNWHRWWFQDEQFSKAKVKRSRHSVITSLVVGTLGRGWRRSSVTRLPQSEKAALQASSKMADKV
jgi:hypothetical protein